MMLREMGLKVSKKKKWAQAVAKIRWWKLNDNAYQEKFEMSLFNQYYINAFLDTVVVVVLFFHWTWDLCVRCVCVCVGVGMCSYVCRRSLIYCGSDLGRISV